MSARLYFDVGSPYVYLALERLERFDLGEVELRVISLGALFKLTGRSSWARTARRAVGMAEVEARASAYDLPRCAGRRDGRATICMRTARAWSRRSSARSSSSRARRCARRSRAVST